jgi:hypothetical protein
MLFIISLINGQNTPTHEWVKQMGEIGNSSVGSSICTDASGNVYITGFFDGTMDFDPGPSVFSLTATGAADAFVCKLNASGNFVWAKKFGSAGNDYGIELTIDAVGTIFFTGQFESVIDLDPGPSIVSFTSNGQSDIFVCKLDNNGNYIWAKQLGNSFNENVWAITLDSFNNVYISSGFKGTYDFDPGPGVYTLTALGSTDGFICKLDASGNFLSVYRFAGTSGLNETLVKSTKIDHAGNITSIGIFNGTVDFDPGVGVSNLTVTGLYDAFICKLAANGTYMWVKQVSGISGVTTSGTSLTTDISKNIYFTGTYNGPVDFDPGPAIFTYTPQGNEIFVSKLNENGGFLWAKRIQSNGNNKATSINLDAMKNVYFSGSFQGTADFDPGTATYTAASVGGEDLYVCKLDSLGNYDWSANFGAFNQDVCNSVYIDGNNKVHTTGIFSGLIDFDPTATTYTLNGSADIFVHKMGQCLVPAPPTNVTSLNDLLICGPASTTLTAISNGTVSWFGMPTGGGPIGTGSTIVTVNLPIGVYTYYAEATTCANSGSRTAITVSVVSCTGINTESANSETIKVYPNPTNGSFYIEVSERSVLSISNLMGEHIYNLSLNKGLNKIDISEFEKAIYLLKIESSKAVNVVRLIKN